MTEREQTKNFAGVVFPECAKYIRRANRIYSIMDFKDGESLTYYGNSLSPESDAEGYRYYKGESGIRLVHWRDIVDERKEQK